MYSIHTCSVSIFDDFDPYLYSYRYQYRVFNNRFLTLFSYVLYLSVHYPCETIHMGLFNTLYLQIKIKIERLFYSKKNFVDVSMTEFNIIDLERLYNLHNLAYEFSKLSDN